MKLDLLYNGETGEYRICLRPAEEMPLPPPGAVTRLLGCPEDISAQRRCIELFTMALLADRAGDCREEQGDVAGARLYRQKAREDARRALRLLWRIRDEQAAAKAAGLPPHLLPVIGENEAEARAGKQAVPGVFGFVGGGPLSPESMPPAPESNT